MDHNSICILNPNEGKKKKAIHVDQSVSYVLFKNKFGPNILICIQEDNVLSHDPHFSYYQQFNEGVQYFAQLKWRLHPTI